MQVVLDGLLLGRDEERRETLTHFVATVEQYDPVFLDEGLAVLWDELLGGQRDVQELGVGLPEDTPVPAALITPRMLAAWGEGTQEIRRP